MKITDGLQGLYGADLYKRPEPRVNKDVATTENVLKNQSLKKQENPQTDILSVLSNKEVSSLQALFGYETEQNSAVYGANGLRNVHAGMLLDVKG